MITYTKNENWNLIWQECSRICNKQYHLYLCQIVCEMWYIEKECQYCSWSPSIRQVGWTMWSENVTSHNIWFLSTTYHASLYTWQIYTLYMIHIVQVKHPLQKFPDKKPVQKHQLKRYNPRKYHMYQKMIRKCKFQMAHNPWNINHFEKKMFWETVPP